jgi:hypothetical protein
MWTITLIYNIIESIIIKSSIRKNIFRLYHDSLLHSLYLFYNLFSAASLICYNLPNTISTTVRKAEDISILYNLNNERGLLFLFK